MCVDGMVEAANCNNYESLPNEQSVLRGIRGIVTNFVLRRASVRMCSMRVIAHMHT